MIFIYCVILDDKLELIQSKLVTYFMRIQHNISCDVKINASHNTENWIDATSIIEIVSIFNLDI